MWLKKLFYRESRKESTAEGESTVPMEQEEEGDSKIHTVSQEEVDLRYAQLRIIKIKSLNLPHNQIHFAESVFFAEHELLSAKSKSNAEWSNVQLIITDRQLLVTPNIFSVQGKHSLNTNILHIYLGMIEMLEYLQPKKETPRLQFTLKDNRVFLLQSVVADRLKQVEKLVREFGFPNGINKFYAFKYGKIQKKIDGWKIYNYQKEMRRQQVWKYTYNSKKDGPEVSSRHAYQLVDNSSFQLSPTYPEMFIVPLGMTQQDIVRCSKFRTKERLPILTYFFQYQRQCFSSLFRCSQTKGGIMTSRCQQDEQMIVQIAEATRSISKHAIVITGVNCKIYDARGYYAAMGNKISGKGFQNSHNYNCELVFLNIPNIHAVRDSFNRVKSYDPVSQEFLVVLGESGWIDYLYLILSGAKSMAKTMRSGTNVVVHCSDGWDRTTQLSCLTQIILEPYYRTLEGFAVLMQKDWRHCGHKFRVRSGQYHHTDYHPNEKSPVFIQFLDCVLQIMSQFPLSFEFGLNLLTYLSTAYQSNTYGTFLTNSVQEGRQIQLQQETVSVWSDVFEERQKYINHLYRKEGPEVLDISVDSKNFVIWKEFFIEEQSLEEQQRLIFKKEMEINKNLKEQLTRLDQETANLKYQINLKRGKSIN